MPAPEGNEFWKLRSKHGKDKIFTTPQLMWEAACEYFDWCVNNPLIEIDYRGKDAIKVELPKMRAFTMQGLCIFIGCHTQYFAEFKRNLDLSKEIDKEYSLVITRIEEIVYNQKFTGAAAGFLNANIIARDLGLADKSSVQASISKTINLGDGEAIDES